MDVSRRLTPFQQLLVVQAARPDRLQSAMTHFVCRVLNVPSIAPPPLSIRALYEQESLPSEPLLFIITPGSDPSQELKEFAKTAIGEF